MFAVHDEKLFSGMCKWFNHCLHHQLPSKRDTGHNLRHRGHSYQLVSYNFSSTRRCICCLIPVRYFLTSFSWFVCTPVCDVRKNVTSMQ